MKIKKLGFATFYLVSKELSIIMDPQQMAKTNDKLKKVNADICIFSELDYVGHENVLSELSLEDVISPAKRKNVFVINNYGEFEVGGIMIRRFEKSNVYLIDDGYLRIAYMGEVYTDAVKNLGDVDVLIIPVGDGGVYPSVEKTERIISNIEPKYLIPYGYKKENLPDRYSTIKDLQSVMGELGYANIVEQGDLNVATVADTEEKALQVVNLVCA